MEKIGLTVQKREGIGKGAVRRLRKEGYIPAVFYGPSVEPTPLSIKSADLSKVLGTKSRENVLIDLTVEGDGQKKRGTSTRTVLLKDIQRNPVKRNIVHVDLYEVRMDQKIRVSVPIQIVGDAKGVDIGGILQHDTRELDIECLPADLPDNIDIDVTELDIGDSIHVSGLKTVEGITVLNDDSLTLVSIVPPVKEIEVKTAEEVEEEIAESFEEGEKEEDKEREKEA